MAQTTAADLVVYGKIYTSEDNGIVEVIAVKDGKYVYVGDKAGAEAFVEAGTTEVIDYTGKGLIMPSCVHNYRPCPFKKLYRYHCWKIAGNRVKSGSLRA